MAEAEDSSGPSDGRAAAVAAASRRLKGLLASQRKRPGPRAGPARPTPPEQRRGRGFRPQGAPKVPRPTGPPKKVVGFLHPADGTRGDGVKRLRLPKAPRVARQELRELAEELSPRKPRPAAAGEAARAPRRTPPGKRREPGPKAAAKAAGKGKGKVAPRPRPRPPQDEEGKERSLKALVAAQLEEDARREPARRPAPLVVDFGGDEAARERALITGDGRLSPVKRIVEEQRLFQRRASQAHFSAEGIRRLAALAERATPAGREALAVLRGWAARCEISTANADHYVWAQALVALLYRYEVGQSFLEPPYSRMSNDLTTSKADEALARISFDEASRRQKRALPVTQRHDVVLDARGGGAPVLFGDRATAKMNHALRETARKAARKRRGGRAGLAAPPQLETWSDFLSTETGEPDSQAAVGLVPARPPPEKMVEDDAFFRDVFHGRVQIGPGTEFWPPNERAYSPERRSPQKEAL